ncbi:MAG: choice-of-anchor D domain-containing protein [Acidobacteria bacterium]|nr:choice-of-anchor D domain-containing protein [Acidobacteriota bacterium]
MVAGAILALSIAWASMSSASAAGAGRAGAGAIYGPHAAGTVIVKLKSRATPGDHESLRAELGATRRHTFRSGAEHWKLPPGLSTEEAIARLRRNPKVEYAEPDYVVQTAIAPNDPGYPQLYGLHNAGQTGGKPGADIHAEQAWDLTTGSRGALVAVIDTGIDLHHPDLEANIWTNPGEIPGNGIDDDGNGLIDDVHGWDFANDDNDPSDDNGHGTHVSGTIGAIGDNGVGVVGVCWQVSIVPLKFLDASGSGFTSNAIRAIDYATSLHVRVMSNSWSGSQFTSALLEAIQSAAAADILFVAAAGNNGTNDDAIPAYPAAYDAPNIIAVAATDDNDEKASFTNYGPTTVDIAAPGVDILSTVPGGYGFKSGTSMATPMVSGAAALLFGAAPSLSALAARDLLLVKADPLPSLTGFIATGARLNAFAPLLGQDTTPPGAIADLAATGATSGSIFLSFTATGDDGSSGTAASYDVRFATSPIDASSFDAATRATGAPRPGPAGSPQAMEVTGLLAGTTYYLALEAIDEFGNRGPVSNAASATTLPPPTIATSPASFTESLPTGASVTRPLTIRNAGLGTLDWRIPVPELALPASANAAGDATAAGAGGPDPFGYRYVDSDEPGEPPFAWSDLASTGTPIAGMTGDTQFSSPIALGFKFPFYGGLFDTVRVATDGYLTFTSTLASGQNVSLPSANAPANLVAPFWADLDFKGTGRAVYVADGSSFTVQYTATPRFSGGGVYTFQVTLRDTGEISFRYLAMTGPTNIATVGLQDGTQTDALQIAFNEPYVHDRLAVRLIPLAQWLTTSPSSGRLFAGESQEIAVKIDAGRLSVGTYLGSVVVENNDPASPEARHDVTLGVTGASAIDVEPRSIEFGTVFAGFASVASFTVANTGTDDLHVASIAAGDPAVSFAPASFTLPVGGRILVTATYAPAAPSALATSLVIGSDAGNAPGPAVAIHGVAIPAPALAASPAALSASLRTGEMATATLTLTNPGAADLDVDLAPEQGTASITSFPPPPVVSNGGFETGNFSGWSAITNGRRTGQGWTPARAGSGFFGNSRPLEGTFDAVNAFDGESRLIYTLSQSIQVPAATLAAELSYYDRIQFDSLGLPISFPRVYDARIEDPNNGALLAPVVHLEIKLNGRPYTDLGWQRRSVDLTPFAGRTVRLVIRETIPESFTGPALIEFDAFRIGSALLHTWLDVAPRHATIPAGGTADFGVAFDATGSSAAVYQGSLRVDAGGQAAVARVPATLTVRNAPDIVVARTVESAPDVAAYFTAGATTLHRFPVSDPPIGSGTLELTATGDYGNNLESATMSVEGAVVGTIGLTGADCFPATLTFPIDAAPLAAAAADGVVTVDVRNTNDVGIVCAVNSHAVKLTYRTLARALDFGSFFVGLTRSIDLTIENLGTDILNVTSIASDDASFRPAFASVRLAPGTARTVRVEFEPPAVGDFRGTLTISSDDPDTPRVTLPLAGTALPAPVASAAPAALSTTLVEGMTEHDTLTLSNAGGSPLSFTLRAAPLPFARAAAASGSPIGPGVALVTEFSSGELSSVDTTSGAVTRIASGLAGPNKGLVVSAGGNVVYVAESLSGEVVGLDLVARSIRVIAAGLSFPNGLALSPNGESLYVTDTTTNRLVRVNLLSGAATPVVSSLVGPNGVTINAAGDTAYIADTGDAALVRVDLATGKLSAVASGLNGPVAVVLDPSETIAYVAESGGGSIDAVALATGTVRPVVAGLDHPGSLTLSADGQVIFVTEFSAGTLDSVDIGTGTIARVATGLGGPVGVTFGTLPTYLALTPATGTVPPFGSVDVDVAVDSTGLFSGTYANDIDILSDDPVRPLLVVPSTLTVIGVPRIKLTGPLIILESNRSFFTRGALTTHRFPITVPPGGAGTAELIANGDFGDPTETATLAVEGTILGSIGGIGTDCATASAVFPVSDAALEAAAADGVLEITVQNSVDAAANCPENSHLVRLTYRGSSEHLDFGSVPVGDDRTLTLLIQNTGSELLDVLSITSDSSLFAPDLASVRVAPRSFQILTVRFTPTAASDAAGTLTIVSNDGSNGVLTVALSGKGEPPPIATASPAAIETTLTEGDRDVRTLTIGNAGDSGLDYSIIVRSHTPGAVSTSFAGLGNGNPRPSSNATPGAPSTPEGRGSPARFEAIPGDFEPLNPSPGPITCVVEDPIAGYVYAQGSDANAFFRYVGATGAWQQLTPAPVRATNNCGAAILNGKIYTAYADNGTLLGVYDIATNAWTAMPGPIGIGTGDIASDGSRYLYLASGTTFVRLDPAAAVTTPLADPPFEFTPWGGLRHLDGALFGHQGNGETGFATYDIASDRWTGLPPVPGGAVLGATIDPGRREYFAYGSYGGTNLYRYAIDSGAWKVATIPFFTLDDGGLAWLPGTAPSIYLAQGEGGSDFARYRTSFSFVSVAPAAGAVPPSGAAPVTVTIETLGLNSGTYDAGLSVTTNDPLRKSFEIPVRVHVNGIPRARVVGEPLVVTSAIDYTTDGARTIHLLPITSPPTGAATVSIKAEGDFSLPSESATVLVEGSPVGIVGATGTDCTVPAEGTFPIDAAAFAASAADGIVRVEVLNTNSVGVFCGVNRHTVTLRYSGRADRLDFGELFVGRTRAQRIIIQNVGTEVLDVPSVRSDVAEFSPSITSIAIPPGASAPVTVTFTPVTAGSFAGTLRIATSDADNPELDLALTGTGLTPPVIDIEPRSLSSTLLEDRREVRDLVVANRGGSPLKFSALVRFDSAITGLPGAFERLHVSPSALTCIVADPASGTLYGQDLFGTRFFRYRPATDSWEPLAEAPAQQSNGCSATLLDGKIYTVSVTDGFLSAVYDIASDAWTQILFGLNGATANVASDGGQFIYASSANAFFRFDVTAGTMTELRGPPFAFDSKSGLGYLDGFVYGHQGGGHVGFARYSVAGNAWEVLPDLPGGAGLGAAIDPIAREYFAYGPNAGTNLYRYSIDKRAWSVSTIPFFPIFDGGLGWLSGASPGVYFVQGGTGAGFARLINEPGFVRLDALSGSIPAFSTALLHVTFDAAGLGPGVYSTTLRFSSNDPLTPLVEIPASLRVVSLPAIAVLGEPVVLASRRDYTSTGARTIHAFDAPIVPEGAGSLELTATGDFGAPSKTATLDAETIATGAAGNAALQCGTVTTKISLSDVDLRRLVADGTLRATVQNSADVTAPCPVNRHAVVLTYRGSASALDFGRVLHGLSARRSVIVENVGTLPLVVDSISIDTLTFTTGATSFTLAPGENGAVAVDFAPVGAGAVSGHLRIHSNDSATPLVTVALQGLGAEPALATASPSSVVAALPPMSATTRQKALHLTNTGGSDLAWSTALLPTFGASSPATIGASPRRLGAGGPDAFGYVLRDSEHLGGPVFAWTDIQTIGTQVAVSGNNATSPAIPLGFGFPFYGNSFSSVRVCTNGWLSFTSPRSNAGNPETLPSTSFQVPENLLAPFWDDLDFGAVRKASSYSDGDRFIVQYTNVTRAGGGPAFTFQVILDRSGRIVFQYLTMAGALDSATIGIQNADKTIGLLAAFDEPFVHDGLAVAFDRVPTFVTAAPLSGVIPPGGAADVTVTFSSAGLASGDYGATLVLSTSDPFRASMLRPLVLHAREIALDYAAFIPSTLNLKSNGNTVRGVVQLPAGFDPHDIDVASVRLEGALGVVPSPVTFPDENGDGVKELSLKFDRAGLAALLGPGAVVPVAITGEVRDIAWFRGSASITPIRPQIKSPASGAVLLSGGSATIAWDPPASVSGLAYDVSVSLDGGASWTVMASRMKGTSLAWTVPSGGRARIRVSAFASGDLVGYDTSGEFAIASAAARPGSVRDLFVAEDGPDLVLTWVRPDVDAAHGVADRYRVLQSATGRGPWSEVASVTSESVRVPAGASTFFLKIVASNAAGDGP